MIIDKNPTFLFNKDTNEIVMVEEKETTLGVRISLYRHDRVIYEDAESNKETIHKFVAIMEDLEDNGFEDIKHQLD